MKQVLRAAAAVATRGAVATPASRCAAVGVRRFTKVAADHPRMHESIIPTFHFQKSLPRLPIPKLDDTLNNYLFFVEPLLRDEATKTATRAAVEAFRSGPGPALQAHLEKWDKEHPGTSYISAMWYEMYLANRDPLPLNLNPQLTWQDVDDPARMKPAARAADIVYQAVRFYNALEARTLVPDVFHTKPHISKANWFQHVAALAPQAVSWYVGYAAGAYALDMSQYDRLFRSTRLPKRGADELWSAPAKDARHIVVQRGPRFYTVEVLHADGRPVDPATLEASFAAVLADSAGASYAAEPPVGALTGLERNAWADTRATLSSSSAVNAASLASIDSALFVLTLDDASPVSHEAMNRAMLHGDARNRWFDKCLNIIVCANGKAGVNWEHAWGDGVAVLYFFNEVYKALGKMPARAAASVPGGSAAPKPTRLAWELAAATGIVPAIRAAEAFTDGVIASTDLNVFTSNSMPKADILASHLNADGVMQMIMQLAHWYAHGYTPSTYESASTAGFKHGRTEVVRPATPLSVAMCKVFEDKASTGVQRYEALSKATNRHKKSTYAALMGKGVDRHLFALQTWAERLKGAPTGPLTATPAIFTDAGYATFKDIRLSTSTLVSPALQGGGFGPVSRHSYGVGYGTDDRGVHFNIMNYKGADTDSHKFADAAERALQEFHKCIEAAKAAGTLKPAGGA